MTDVRFIVEVEIKYDAREKTLDVRYALPNGEAGFGSEDVLVPPDWVWADFFARCAESNAAREAFYHARSMWARSKELSYSVSLRSEPASGISCEVKMIHNDIKHPNLSLYAGAEAIIRNYIGAVFENYLSDLERGSTPEE